MDNIFVGILVSVAVFVFIFFIWWFNLMIMPLFADEYGHLNGTELNAIGKDILGKKKKRKVPKNNPSKKKQ